MSHGDDARVSRLIRSQAQESCRSRDILAGSRGRRHTATEWLNPASAPTDEVIIPVALGRNRTVLLPRGIRNLPAGREVVLDAARGDLFRIPLACSANWGKLCERRRTRADGDD
jgi:hypothetical protein